MELFGESDQFNPDKLVETSDFESIKIKVKLFNLVSGTAVKDEEPIEVIQLLDTGFLIEVKRGSCSINHHMAVEVSAVTPHGETIELKTTAKVESARSLYEMSEHSLIESRDLIHLRLLQYNEDLLKKLQNLFEHRRIEIEKFLMDAKGIA